jgi:hypothetical protein
MHPQWFFPSYALSVVRVQNEFSDVVYTNTEFSVTKQADRFLILDNGFSIMEATSVW